MDTADAAIVQTLILIAALYPGAGQFSGSALQIQVKPIQSLEQMGSLASFCRTEVSYRKLLI